MSTWFRRTKAGPDLDQRIRRIATRRAKAVVEGVSGRVSRLESDAAVVRVDLERIAHQLRALEQRLDSERADVGPTSGEPIGDDPAAVLAEIRREHERIRIRFQTMTRYEERLRRIEDAVVKLYGGDLRGPGRTGT
jgi:hypothetical protein